MTIPQNVHDYWGAQWWVAIHFAPVAALVFLFTVAFSAWQEYSGEDEKAKESEIVSLNLTKKAK